MLAYMDSKWINAGVINANYMDSKLNIGDIITQVERIEMSIVVEDSKPYNFLSCYV